MATPMPESRSELSWLLDDLTQRVPGIRHAIVLSADGLAMGGSRELTREDTEHLSAISAGSHSLASGAGRHFGLGGVRQTIIELEGASCSSPRRGREPGWPCWPRATPNSAW